MDYVQSYLWHDTASTGPHNKNIAFSYTIGTCATTGINNSGVDQENVSIYPNPAKDNLIVKLGSLLLTHMEINITQKNIKYLNYYLSNKELSSLIMCSLFICRFIFGIY